MFGCSQRNRVGGAFLKMEMRNGKNRFMCIMTIRDFAALTADVITDYCYGWSYGYLDGEKGSVSNDLLSWMDGPRSTTERLEK
jgi:hypothetical protein